MIVPSKRRFVPTPNVLVKGKLYSVESGLGGSYTVEYTGKENGYHWFHFPKKYRPHDDFPKNDFWFTDEEIATKVYICPPQEAYYECVWDEERCDQSGRPDWAPSDKEAWFPPTPDALSYRNLVKKGLASKEALDALRRFPVRAVVCFTSDQRECVLDLATGLYKHVLNSEWTITPDDPRITKIVSV